MNNAVEPFYKDSGGGNPKGYSGEHVVVVRDINQGPPAKVAVDNQYKRESDHLGDRMMPLRSLYLATMPTDKAIEHLRHEIKDDHAHGRRDRAKEEELRRLQRFTPPRECRG